YPDTPSAPSPSDGTTSCRCLLLLRQECAHVLQILLGVHATRHLLPSPVHMNPYTVTHGPQLLEPLSLLQCRRLPGYKAVQRRDPIGITADVALSGHGSAVCGARPGQW